MRRSLKKMSVIHIMRHLFLTLYQQSDSHETEQNSGFYSFIKYYRYSVIYLLIFI